MERSGYFNFCCNCYWWCATIGIVNRWKRNKKIDTGKKARIINVPEKIKTEVGTYDLIHETKAAFKHFNKIYPKYIFLKHTSTTGKTKLRRTRKEKLFPNRKIDQIYFHVTWWQNLKQLWLGHALMELL